jgi:phosphatidylglycerophosphate synthase
MAVAPQHWLSLARLVVGVAVWFSLSRGNRFGLVLVLVLVACALDFSDGRLARARGSESPFGRVLDNVCDFAFLAMFFHAAAGIELWSDTVAGAIGRHRPDVNAVPLIALTLSFGSYAVRAAVCTLVAAPVAPSPIGRAAGVLNYMLAIVGAASRALDTDLRMLATEVAMVAVALVNIAAFAQNCALLLRQIVRRPA